MIIGKMPKKLYLIVSSILVLIGTLGLTSTSVLANSSPTPTHTDNIIVGGQYTPGTQGTELDIIINGGPALAGWCVNEHVDIYVNTQYSADIYNYRDYFGESSPTTIGLLPAAVTTNTYTNTQINWPAITYILNNKINGTPWQDVQKAIWYFSDGDTSGLSANAQTMVDSANTYLNAHNGVFIPAPGQVEPMICYVPGDTALQVIFYEYTVPALPDLVITSVSAIPDPAKPTWYRLSITVKNQGNADAAANDMSVQINGGEISNPTCPALEAGASATITVPSDELGAITGTMDNITVFVNASQSVAENTFSNDSASTTYSIYTIVASAGTRGSISPTGNDIVGQGDNQTFSISPDNGYKIADVQVDGVSVGDVTSYTFNSVSAAHTIFASFSHMAPTWDVNGDHICDVLDLIAIGNVIGQTGAPGWIAADLNQDGVVNVLDLIQAGNHIGQAW